MPRDEKAIAEYVEQSAAVLAAAGFPRMPARVLMALTVTDAEGLTARELADYLGVSPAAISGAVRYLQSIHLVHRVPQPGSRVDRYELPRHSWYTASLGKNPVYEAVASMSKRALPAFGGDSLGAERVAEMIDFYAFLERRLPELMAEWIALGTDGRPSS